MNAPNSTSLVSVLFAAGMRPDAAVLGGAGAVRTEGGFAVTLEAKAEGEDWAELLASGLTFDCRGIAPGPAASPPPIGTLLGLSEQPAGETITLQPGPHIASGVALQPVLRILLALAANLARLPGVVAVCWHPAQSWMAPEYFTRIAADWLGGGAFPALGLTTLLRDPAGGVTSNGLAFLIGQELELSTDLGLSAEALAKLAVRLIDTLYTLGPVVEPREFALDGQPIVLAEPLDGGVTLKIAPPLHVG
jgi:hypothetical protein